MLTLLVYEFFIYLPLLIGKFYSKKINNISDFYIYKKVIFCKQTHWKNYNKYIKKF